MRLASLVVSLASLPLLSLAFVDPEPIGEYDVAAAHASERAKPQSMNRYESTSAVTPGVCYSPFHDVNYPLHGGPTTGVEPAMQQDFAVMKNYVSVVRTYYSSYYGYSVAKQAAVAGVRLFLGVYMTSETWGDSQYTDAVTAVREYPSTVSAILVGNENISPVGPYTPSDISARVSDMRQRVVTGTGRAVPIGTVQRATEWLDASRRSEMLALAATCDIIGVNIYPFFDPNYDAAYPLAGLNAVWDQMVAVYGAAKLRLTEIGFPTGGAPTTSAPNNMPSLANSRSFYSAFVKWSPSQGGNEAFWFMFFDRRPDDDTMQSELEKYFGFFTYDRRAKAADYPALLSAFSAAAAAPPATTTPAPATTTPRPTTTTPPPTTTTPVTPAPTTAAPKTTTTTTTTIVLPAANLPLNVCQVRKSFF